METTQVCMFCEREGCLRKFMACELGCNKQGHVDCLRRHTYNAHDKVEVDENKVRSLIGERYPNDKNIYMNGTDPNEGEGDGSSARVRENRGYLSFWVVP